MKKIVITGGSCAGRTTTIEEFSRQDYTTVSEAAGQIIQELNQKFGVEGQKKWRMENFAKFQTMIAEKQAELESKIMKSVGVVFLDRGIPDSIAMCRLRNVKVPQRILDLAKTCFYDIIFIFDTLSNFDQRSETGRMLTRELSLKLRDLTKEVYEEYGYKTIFVKEIPFRDRIDFIKRYL